MKKEQIYKIVIGVLSLVIILQWVFIIITRPKKAPLPGVPFELKARIAIVIDDWGYNLDNLYMLDQIKYPLTASILPNLSYSREVSEELRRRGIEIILHLPMEPYEKYRLEKNTIMTSFDEATIRNIIDQDLASIVYARGVSNHMGSLATVDLRTMEIIFKELKKRQLYFLDNLVSSKSICSDLARKMNLRSATRDVFLDNKEEPEYIRRQIYKLESRAKMKGWAIGVGHDRKITLEILKEVMSQLDKKGYRFVFISDLAN